MCMLLGRVQFKLIEWELKNWNFVVFKEMCWIHFNFILFFIGIVFCTLNIYVAWIQTIIMYKQNEIEIEIFVIKTLVIRTKF